MIRFLSGPFAGKEFPVHGKETTIGRSNEAEIVVTDKLLSRLHLRIYLEQGTWFIEDLNSSNGTWIGGSEVKGARVIENYQRVRVGNSLLEVEFRNKCGSTHPSIAYSFKPEPPVDDTSQLPIEHIRGEHRRLSVMYNLQNQLCLVLDEHEIYSVVASALMGEITADYLYILLYDDKKDAFVPSYGRDREGRAINSKRHPVSQSVLNYVRQKREAVLSIDPLNDIRFASDSAVIRRTHQVICVPVIFQREILGAIYVAVMEHRDSFDEEDLQLLAGIAFSSAMAIMNCRLFRKNLTNERMAALGTTAASLSHYIKNILTGIDGCLYLLKMGIDETDADLMNEALGILSRNHKRLSGLVMDLLNLAKEHNLDLHVQNVTEIILEAVELVRPNFTSMGVDIALHPSLGSESMMAEIDSLAMHRVLLNLLNNACDAVNERFKGESGGCISVQGFITDNGQILEVVIEDNGCGIPP